MGKLKRERERERDREGCLRIELGNTFLVASRLRLHRHSLQMNESAFTLKLLRTVVPRYLRGLKSCKIPKLREYRKQSVSIQNLPIKLNILSAFMPSLSAVFLQEPFNEIDYFKNFLAIAIRGFTVNESANRKAANDENRL